MALIIRMGRGTTRGRVRLACYGREGRTLRHRHCHRHLHCPCWQQERERLAAEPQELEQLVSASGMARNTGRPRRWPELRQHLLLPHFGRWSLQEYDAIMCQLLKNGSVRCEWRRKTAPDGTNTERVPGDEDMLFWK